MATRNKLRAAFFGTRILAIATGCLAVLWGLYVLPIYRSESGVERTANKIIQGQRFGVNVLAEQRPYLEKVEYAVPCRFAAVRAAAIIRMRLLEETADAANLAESKSASVRRAIFRALSCSPADSFLWLALYAISNNQAEPVNADKIKFLRLSYKLGPNEGWISVRRNPITLSMYEELPAEMAQMAVDEFARLVESGFYDEAFYILINPAWRVRDVLLKKLKDVPRAHRAVLAKRLYEHGYDVEVPDIERPVR
jgi:hypothetical protein